MLISYFILVKHSQNFKNLIFHFSAYTSFEVKELLNFQKPFPQVGISFNSSEKNIGSWSVEKEGRTSVFMTDSCSVLEIRKKSSLSSMKLEMWFCRNVKRLALGFLILHISSKQRVSFISINFARNIFFNIGFLPDASNLESKIKLKSSPKTIYFVIIINFFKKFMQWERYIAARTLNQNCINWISKKFLSFHSALKTRICPFLSYAVFTTLKASATQEPKATPPELLFLCEKIEDP